MQDMVNTLNTIMVSSIPAYEQVDSLLACHHVLLLH